MIVKVSKSKAHFGQTVCKLSPLQTTQVIQFIINSRASLPVTNTLFFFQDMHLLPVKHIDPVLHRKKYDSVWQWLALAYQASRLQDILQCMNKTVK